MIKEKVQESRQKTFFNTPFTYTPVPPFGLYVAYVVGVISEPTAPPTTQSSFYGIQRSFNAVGSDQITASIKNWTSYPPNATSGNEVEVDDPKKKLELRNGAYAFVYYIKYHAEVSYATIPKNICEEGLQSINQKLIGVQEMVDSLKNFLVPYQNPTRGWDDIPRGFLFWGPPGTGKTVRSKLMRLCHCI